VPPPTKLKKQYVNIVSQNTRGLSEDKEEELITRGKSERCLLDAFKKRGEREG